MTIIDALKEAAIKAGYKNWNDVENNPIYGGSSIRAVAVKAMQIYADAKVKENEEEFLIALAEKFLSWKNELHSEIRGGVVMYDVPKHYKWLSEEELFRYFMDFGRYDMT